LRPTMHTPHASIILHAETDSVDVAYVSQRTDPEG